MTKITSRDHYKYVEDVTEIKLGHTGTSHECSTDGNVELKNPNKHVQCQSLQMLEREQNSLSGITDYTKTKVIKGTLLSPVISGNRKKIVTKSNTYVVFYIE